MGAGPGTEEKNREKTLLRLPHLTVLELPEQMFSVLRCAVLLQALTIMCFMAIGVQSDCNGDKREVCVCVCVCARTRMQMCVFPIVQPSVHLYC